MLDVGCGLSLVFFWYRRCVAEHFKSGGIEYTRNWSLQKQILLYVQNNGLEMGPVQCAVEGLQVIERKPSASIVDLVFSIGCD